MSTTEPTYPRWNATGLGDGASDIPTQIKADGVVPGDDLPFNWFNRLQRRTQQIAAWLSGSQQDAEGVVLPGRRGRSRAGASSVVTNTAVETTFDVRHDIAGTVVSPWPLGSFAIHFEGLIEIDGAVGAATIVPRVRVGTAVVASRIPTAVVAGDRFRFRGVVHVDGNSGTPGGREYTRLVFSHMTGEGADTENFLSSALIDTEGDSDVTVSVEWNAAFIVNRAFLRYLHVDIVPN